MIRVMAMVMILKREVINNEMILMIILGMMMIGKRVI